VARRLLVIGPALGFMAFAVLWLNGRHAVPPSTTTAEAAMLLLGPFLGPFIGLLGPLIGFRVDPIGDCLLTGLPLLALIASHPVYPRRWTGVLCVVGMLIWFHLGMRYIC
jgi:hypothetical protein